MFSDMQTYESHRQYIPLFHFFAAPILGLNVLVQLYFLIRHFSGWGVWNLLVAGALAGFAYAIKYTGGLAIPFALGYVLWRSRVLRFRPSQSSKLRVARDDERRASERTSTSRRVRCVP